MQRQLKRRGYVIGRAGLVDARTARAVLAFRKVSGLSRTSTADLTVMRRLADGGGSSRSATRGHGKHIEADLSRQVFAMIRGKRVERIYHTSTGSPGDADDPGQLQVLPLAAGHEREGHGPLAVLHPRLRDPRLPVRAGVPGVAMDACESRSPMRWRSSAGSPRRPDRRLRVGRSGAAARSGSTRSAARRACARSRARPIFAAAPAAAAPPTVTEDGYLDRRATGRGCATTSSGPPTARGIRSSCSTTATRPGPTRRSARSRSSRSGC